MAAMGTMVTAWQPPDAEAVVVCQRKQKFRLRADACKAKETSVFDTSALDVERGRVDEHDGQLDEQDARLEEHTDLLGDQSTRVDNLEIALAQKCAGDPERRAAPVSLVGGGSPGLGCRAFDGDQASCDQRFQSGEGGAAACAYLNDNCIACHIFYDAIGLCENPCSPITPCADAARITSVGDCDDVTTQPNCEQSWGLSTAYPKGGSTVQPTTCWWDGASCNECQPDDISNGDCTNTCLAADQFPACRAEGRTYGDCDQLNGNEAGCLATYEFNGLGTHTCWYDAGECSACDPESEQAGSCQNLC